jgi:hypothetical protein
MIKVEITDARLPGSVCVLTKTIKIFGITIYNKKQTYFV